MGESILQPDNIFVKAAKETAASLYPSHKQRREAFIRGAVYMEWLIASIKTPNIEMPKRQ